ncbi:MAG: diaminopimelate decarboxylase [bacterium]
MHHFHYKGDELYCEEVPVNRVAEEVGTPFYLYSTATLERHYRAFEDALQNTDHLVCYSVKANSNLAVLALFARLGSGFDIVSGGELFRALQVKSDPGKMVFSGVGKTQDEIRSALDAGILMFNVESLQELREINRIAGEMGKTARISLRVNPDVDPRTHPYISTGLKESKFGIPIAEALNAYRLARTLSHLEPVGVDCHIGSQLTELSPFEDALHRLRELIDSLREDGFTIRYLDLGGGLGINYDEEEPPHPTEYGKMLIEKTRGLDCTLIFEPGRVITGNAGILVTRILYTKENLGKNFTIVDAGMNDMIRPSLYGAYHKILPVQRSISEKAASDVVGPICESGDFMARDRKIQPSGRGDLLAVMSAGAYGFVMSSNYNSRLRVPEILVSEDRFYVVRSRETLQDLVHGESVPDFLRGKAL